MEGIKKMDESTNVGLSPLDIRHLPEFSGEWKITSLTHLMVNMVRDSCTPTGVVMTKDQFQRYLEVIHPQNRFHFPPRFMGRPVSVESPSVPSVVEVTVVCVAPGGVSFTPNVCPQPVPSYRFMGPRLPELGDVYRWDRGSGTFRFLEGKNS